MTTGSIQLLAVSSTSSTLALQKRVDQVPLHKRPPRIIVRTEYRQLAKQINRLRHHEHCNTTISFSRRQMLYHDCTRTVGPTQTPHCHLSTCPQNGASEDRHHRTRIYTIAPILYQCTLCMVLLLVAYYWLNAPMCLAQLADCFSLFCSVSSNVPASFVRFC